MVPFSCCNHPHSLKSCHPLYRTFQHDKLIMWVFRIATTDRKTDCTYTAYKNAEGRVSNFAQCVLTVRNTAQNKFTKFILIPMKKKYKKLLTLHNSWWITEAKNLNKITHHGTSVSFVTWPVPSYCYLQVSAIRSNWDQELYVSPVTILESLR